MFEARRLQRRLFLLLLWAAMALPAAQAQTPATTTINGTVYRADGTPAGGTLLIFWPAFTTSGAQVVAAGNSSVTLGTAGALSVALVPNANATPANTVYVVVYQLNDNTVKTEYWVVPTTSPTTIAAVRTTLGSEVSAAAPATQQYVNSALAGKANDNTVVHLSGTETISGVKQFSVSPTVPTPTQASAAANKAYVDSAAAGGGGGSFVSKAGDAMTGPLQLPGDPVSASQASDKHYVDSGLATKADLVAGLVPAAELASGTANNAVCLHGDSTWGGCGGSSNAVSIQSVPVDTTTPTDNQVITYVASLGKYEPRAGSGLTAGMQAVKYAPDFSWSQTASADLSATGAKTVSLGTCALGVTGSEPQYYVYIGGTGTAEAVLVTGGTCAGNGQSGTLQFTTVNTHPAGYTVASASGGLQEALIASRFTPTNPAGGSQSGKVIVSPGEFKAFARVSVRSSNITVDFSGSIVECWMNDACIYVGDGLSLKFYLSQNPFIKRGLTLMDEEYLGAALDLTRWKATDPGGAVSVSGGQLQIAGGTGTDGATTVVFAEKVELGGAFILQHGNVTFGAGSSAVLGGLYSGAISIGGCLAGFKVTPNGSQCNIQALISGAAVGTPLPTVAEHEYALTTRFYAPEVYRRQQIFHSAAHPAGSGFGGAAVAADVRIVLEVHNIDPNNPASLVTASTVLYDGILSSAPGFCTYALVNAANASCALAFTRMIQAVDAEVRSAPYGQAYSTRLVGAMSEGAECTILSTPALEFFSAYVPASGEPIVVRYRGQGRALARVTNLASIAAQQNGSDDGIRAVARHVRAPAPRTSADCENAALALLDGAADSPAAGGYDTWSDFLPGNAQDIFPGDGLQVNMPSRAAAFTAIVRQVEIDVQDLEGEHSTYKIQFADDVAAPLAFGFAAGEVILPVTIVTMSTTQVGTLFLPDLAAAEVTQIASTSVTIDAGTPPLVGGGIEVRWSDTGWGQGNNRNLVGRFNTQTFTLPRLSRVQNYYLRQYDTSSPPKYSRYTSALHVDYPL